MPPAQFQTEEFSEMQLIGSQDPETLKKLEEKNREEKLAEEDRLRKIKSEREELLQKMKEQ